jgi:hypothetical protein
MVYLYISGSKYNKKDYHLEVDFRYPLLGMKTDRIQTDIYINEYIYIYFYSNSDFDMILLNVLNIDISKESQPAWLRHGQFLAIRSSGRPGSYDSRSLCEKTLDLSGNFVKKPSTFFKINP